MQFGAYFPAVSATLPPHLVCACNDRHRLCFLLLFVLAPGELSPALPPPQPASFSPAACCRLHVVPRHNTLFSQRNSAVKHSVDEFWIAVCLRGTAALAQAGAAHVLFARQSSGSRASVRPCSHIARRIISQPQKNACKYKQRGKIHVGRAINTTMSVRDGGVVRGMGVLSASSRTYCSDIFQLQRLLRRAQAAKVSAALSISPAKWRAACYCRAL